MDIWMIWAREHDGTIWLVDAWDDASITEHPEEWRNKVSGSWRDYGDVRVVKARLNLDAIAAEFETPAVIMSDPELQEWN